MKENTKIIFNIQPLWLIKNSFQKSILSLLTNTNLQSFENSRSALFAVKTFSIYLYTVKWTWYAGILYYTHRATRHQLPFSLTFELPYHPTQILIIHVAFINSIYPIYRVYHAFSEVFIQRIPFIHNLFSIGIFFPFLFTPEHDIYFCLDLCDKVVILENFYFIINNSYFQHSVVCIHIL